MLYLFQYMTQRVAPCLAHHKGKRMSLYTSQLIELDAAQPVSQADADLDAMTPLEDRLRRLLRTIPVSVQRGGLPIEALRVRLRGRTKSGCSVAELARCLRRLGFMPHRSWHLSRSEHGAVSLWYPAGYGPELPPVDRPTFERRGRACMIPRGHFSR